MSMRFLVTDKWGDGCRGYDDEKEAIAAAKESAGEEAYTEYVVYERRAAFMGKNRIEVEELAPESSP